MRGKVLKKLGEYSDLAENVILNRFRPSHMHHTSIPNQNNKLRMCKVLMAYTEGPKIVKPTMNEL